jgi:L-threonylcarbamoyladenylate synthase
MNAGGLSVPSTGQDLPTPVHPVDPRLPSEDLIGWAATIMARGGVVIYPTETFYALGGDPLLVAAIERIYQIKGRDWRKPLPLIAADLVAVQRVAAAWPCVAQRLARVFWPGPLTLVIEASVQVPGALLAGTGKVAVRVSSHAVAQKLAAAVGGVVIATSANRSGEPACRGPEQLPADLLAQADGVLHGGITAGGWPSTLVDVTTTPPHLLRAGAISWERVAEVL